jgi:hypothetical protein
MQFASALTRDAHARSANTLGSLSRLRGRAGVGERLAPVFVAAPTLTLPRKRGREKSAARSRGRVCERRSRSTQDSIRIRLLNLTLRRKIGQIRRCKTVELRRRFCPFATMTGSPISAAGRRTRWRRSISPANAGFPTRNSTRGFRASPRICATRSGLRAATGSRWRCSGICSPCDPLRYFPIKWPGRTNQD